jgi:hypothetical protein
MAHARKIEREKTERENRGYYSCMGETHQAARSEFIRSALSDNAYTITKRIGRIWAKYKPVLPH